MSLTDRSAGDGPAGAVDNGSGTVGVMALAKIFSQFSFARTIEYIAFGAEEQGLHGSAHYVAQAQAAGEDIVCALTMDMIGYSNRYFGAAPHLCTLSLSFLRMHVSSGPSLSTLPLFEPSSAVKDYFSAAPC